jgi:hypothetical protein
MRIVTNFPRFPAEWRASDGRQGSGYAARTLMDFIRNRHGPVSTGCPRTCACSTMMAPENPRLRGARLVVLPILRVADHDFAGPVFLQHGDRAGLFRIMFLTATNCQSGTVRPSTRIALSGRIISNSFSGETRL